MKNTLLLGRIFFLMTILAAVFTPSLRAQLTWSGAGGDDNWSTGANWAGTPPTTGDALIFAGSTRLVNTNDLTMTNAWLRFDSGDFKLWGNALSFTNGITNSTGVNQIGTDLSWSSTARNIHVAAGSELVIAGIETVTTGDLTNTGGGRIRLTGKHIQALNPPATILNNIEYVIDGGSFSNAGGVRITSGITPSASTLILTNGATMIQGLAAGAVRVGDFTGIQGTLIIDNSTLTGVGNNMFIPNPAGALGSVIQRGGTNSGFNITFCNNAATGGTGTYEMIGGVLGATQIRKVSTTGSSTISFDGSTLRALATSTTFFTGIDTAEIKSGGMIFDNNGFAVTVNQAFTGVGGLTKTGSGTLTLGSTANAYAGGFALNEGTVSLTANNTFGTGTLTLNGGTIQPSATANRNFTNNITIGGNYTADGSANVTANGNVTLTGDRTITVNIAAAAGAHVLNGNVGESGGTRSITKVGPGVLQLNGAANSYSGNTIVSNGVVQVNSTSRLGNEAGTLVLAGGALYSSANRTVSTAPIGNAISLVADSEIATVSTAAAVDMSLTGVPTTTAGTLTLRNLAASGTGTFEPRFAAGGFNFTSPVTIINNTNGTSFTRLNFFNTNGTDQTFSGVISGNGSVRRSASTGTGGRTILTAANTYSGLTTINDGILVVNNTSGSGTGSGDIVLASSGTLAGTGTVAGAVSGTGSVSPGASAGMFTIGNGLNLSTGGTNIWELAANTTSGAGTSFDRLVLTNGNLVLGGSSRVLVKFIGTATFPDSTNAFWQQTNTWKIIDLTGPAANPGLTIFSGVDGAAGNNAGSFSTSADATGIYLTFTPGVQAPPPLIDSNIVGAGTTNAQLSWSSVAGATYKVQYKTNINQIGWLDLTNLAATGTTTTILDNTSPVPAERYYRVISP